MTIYVVKEGDTIHSIASAAGISAAEIAGDNQILYPYPLAVGQALYLAGKKPSPDPRRLFSFGYAYPFIHYRILNETLPFLSALYVFSYGFTKEGHLIPPASDDAWMIEEAKEARTAPVLTLTPLGEDGRFNNHLVSELVRNPDVSQRLIWELGRTMQEKGFRGLDIDFEYVLAEDRERFADFVSQARKTLNLFGYSVSVALPPKTSADQKGLLYEGIDYGLLGKAANYVMLMTYEWGYSQGPPMAVAPIHMVRRVVDYAVTEIPREKICLGIPNYGYDWPLPFKQGVTRAKTISNVEAVRLAVEQGAEIKFDETAKSPYFRYSQNGTEHEVWFEDVRSILAKFELIKEYGLLGAGYWQLMNYFRANWLMMDEMFQIVT